VNPVKINEFRIGDGANSSNSFIELYNAGDQAVDISGWALTEHAYQMPFFSTIRIPAKTVLGAHSFYLLGMSNSGLVVPAQKGESTLYVRSTEGMSVGDEVLIGSGSTKEIRKITAIRTPPAGDATARPSRVPRGIPAQTFVWQPLPEGPVITFPVGSNSVSVNSVDGFEVGQKMAIGYGATYPVVTQSVEKYEVVTVTEVGKPGTQAWLSMDAKAGDTNIKVSSVANISVGDKIRLDIDSKGHGIEWVVVKSVGTASSRSTFAGPLNSQDNPGTGLELTEPLKFNHASNMPFSVWGTGISFEPASKFPHSSNEPVLALTYSISLDQPLQNNHDIDAVVLDRKVTVAGYQGTREPDQWFGGPALSATAGNMVLRDARGNVADGLNYGAIVVPWLAEGYQAVSGAGKVGCFVATPGGGRGGFGRTAGAVAASPDLSSGRYPDGFDEDSNCKDFRVQTSTAIIAASEPGATNVKVSGVSALSIGQKVIVGAGPERETATIAFVGTAGATTVATASKAGDTVIPVANVDGFSAGQIVTIGSGASSERATIVSITNSRGRFGRNTPTEGPVTSVTIASPLKFAHAVADPVAGTGITFTAPLTKAHVSGSYIAGSIPTPGEPNQY